MISFGFPEMFSKTKSILVEDHDATASNLELLLLSTKKTLFGDPYFGTNLKKLIFEQNSSTIVRDIVLDDIYSAIIDYMPQISLNRNDIDIECEGTTLYVVVKCTNLIDYTTSMYKIKLVEDDVED